MKHIRILILCIAFALLTGCAPAAQDTAAYAPDESERLVLYTSHKKEVWWPIVKEFESRTGIWVEVVQGGTNELLEQLQKEQDAPRADVMFGGGVESLEACRALFEPYVCRGAEQILPQYRAQDSSWTPFFLASGRAGLQSEAAVLRTAQLLGRSSRALRCAGRSPLPIHPSPARAIPRSYDALRAGRRRG